MKKPLYPIASLALALVVSGCSTAPDSPAGASVASSSPEASAESSTSPAAVDPLERLPEHPFGIDPEKILEDPATHGVEVNVAAIDAAAATRAALQVLWLANERQVYFGGPDRAKLEGSLRDAEHFLVPEWLGTERERAEKGLAFADDFAAGRETSWRTHSEGLTYPFHYGSVTTTELDPVPSESEKKWPEAAEDPESFLWVPREEGDASSWVPHRISDGMQITPRIHNIEETVEGTVAVRFLQERQVPFLDGSTGVVTHDAWFNMALSDGMWKVQGWDLNDNPRLQMN